MRTRIPGSMRTRQSLSDLIEGRLSTPDGRSELVKLATRFIVEEGLEAESREAVGRDYYAHGAAAGQGHRNGVRTGRLKTAEGLVDIRRRRSPAATSRSRSTHQGPNGAFQEVSTFLRRIEHSKRVQGGFLMSDLNDAIAKATGEHAQTLRWFGDHTGRTVRWSDIQAHVDQEARLVNQAKGIYKPHYMEYALSVRQTSRKPLCRQRHTAASGWRWVYPYFQENPDPTQRDEKPRSGAWSNA